MVNLLDTHVLLWAIMDPDQLTASAKTLVSADTTSLSVASYWEIAIKAQKKLLAIPDAINWWDRAAAVFGNRVLPIRASHVTALVGLPNLHRDPFDRILIAQAVSEGMTLVTNDEQIRAYAVRVSW